MIGSDRQQQSQDCLASRGVYELPYLGPHGERYLVAVDQRGRRVAEMILYPDMKDLGLATELLRTLLDREDPPYLRVLD